jgi:hypothetical protein
MRNISQRMHLAELIAAQALYSPKKESCCKKQLRAHSLVCICILYTHLVLHV